MPKKDADEVLRCSFCNKSQREVKKLIAGPTVFICDECVDVCLDIIAEDRMLERKEQPSSVPSLLKILDERLVGQAAAKPLLATVFGNHKSRVLTGDLEFKEKSNLLLIGPTGSGKTLAINLLAQELGLPFVTVDAARLSGLSYFKEVDILKALYDQAEGNAEAAGKGVVCIEQIDRILSREMPKSLSLRVQENLLQILEGTVLEVPVAANKVVTIDTRYILFVGCGTFLGVDARLGGEALIRFGLLPEFAARFPICIGFEALGESEMIELLTRPGGLLDEYLKLFQMEGVNLSFNQEAIRAIACEAARRQAGARSLRSLLESLALDLSSEFATGIRKEYVVVDISFLRNRLGIPESYGEQIR